MRFFKQSATVLAVTAMWMGAGSAWAQMAPNAPVSDGVRGLSDVPAKHWAAQSIRTLQEKYDVMLGFSDRTFRGSKTMTRYELAAALAKLLTRIEERIAIATGAPVDVSGDVSVDDLRTIAKLQREFREELDALKIRTDGIDARIATLEKRVRISGVHRVDYRDFLADPPGNTLTNALTGDVRWRNSLNFDAELGDDLSATGTLNIDIYSPQSSANAFLRGVNPAAPVTDVYAVKSLLTYNPGWMQYAVGMGAMRQHLDLGSGVTDPFKRQLWQNGSGGYGFVGTPALRRDGSFALSGGNAGAPLWLPGTNVIEDVLDPNNSSLLAPHGNWLTASRFALGPINVGLGYHRGALAGFGLFGGIAGLGDSLPAMQMWNTDGQAIATLGFNLAGARFNVLANSPGASVGDTQRNDKTFGASLDLGNDALNLSAEVLGTGSWGARDFAASKGSLRLGSSDIFGTGIGLSAGMVSGSLNGSRNNLLIGGADYTSLGLVMKTPALMMLPSVTVAAQNTGRGLALAGVNGAISSGISVSTDVRLFGLPAINLEYSRAKFGATGDQSLWGPAGFSHDQLALGSTVKF